MKYTIRWTVLASLLVLMACKMPQSHSSPPGLTINWTRSTSARTILPASYPAVATYDIALTATGQTAVSQTGLTVTSYTFPNLASANWTVTVTGRDASGNALVQGSTQVDLSPYGNGSVNITLYYLTNGTGTGGIAVTFDWTGSGYAVDSASMVLTAPDQSASSPTLSVAGTSTQLTLAGIPTGSYQAALTLMWKGKTVAMPNQSILVVPTTTTTATLALTQNDFIGYRSTVIAGTGAPSGLGDGVQATSAALYAPQGLFWYAPQNALYIADTYHQVIRKIDCTTGLISTVAGNGTSGFSGDGGSALTANLSSPYDVCLDGNGNIYIADTGNQRVRRVDAVTGFITTVAGRGSGGAYTPDPTDTRAIAAQLNWVTGVAVDAQNNFYICDENDFRIRKVTVADGTIVTVAGNGNNGTSGDSGQATAATISNPYKLLVMSDGTIIFSQSDYNNSFRKVAPSGVISTLITTTNGSPGGLWLDGSGNLFFTSNDGVEKRTAGGAISTIISSNGNGYTGDGGPASAAKLWSYSSAITGDSQGNVYVLDPGNNVVREVLASNGTITTFAGSYYNYYNGDQGQATAGFWTNPVSGSIAQDSARNIFIADTGENRIRRIDGSTGIITTVAGNGSSGFSGDGRKAIWAQFKNLTAVTVDSSDNLYVTDNTNGRIRRIDGTTGIVTTVAGDGSQGYQGDGGQANLAQVYNPDGLCVDASNNLYFCDTGNNVIRMIKHATNVISTVAGFGQMGDSGDGGPATSAKLNQPRGVFVDPSGDIYIADSGNNRIRRVDAATGDISTVAGVTTAGYSGDGGPAVQAKLSAPIGVGLDANGFVWIGDTGNNRVRRVAPSGAIITIAGGYSGVGALGIGLTPGAIVLNSSGQVYTALASNTWSADGILYRIDQ
jgi:sugar lactone lactonase YvrE